MPLSEEQDFFRAQRLKGLGSKASAWAYRLVGLEGFRSLDLASLLDIFSGGGIVRVPESPDEAFETAVEASVLQPETPDSSNAP